MVAITGCLAPPLGIGRALIREGLERLRAPGPRGCSLVGHPQRLQRRWAGCCRRSAAPLAGFEL